MEVISSSIRKSIIFIFAVLPPLLLVGCGGDSASNEAVPTGTLSLLTGNTTGAGNFDGVGTEASFYQPRGVAVSDDGTLYVADAFNNKIREISPTGVVTTLAGSGEFDEIDGAGAQASFVLPSGIAMAGDGTLYVADSATNTIRVITPSGVVTTLTDLSLVSSQEYVDQPSGIAVDVNNISLYVTNSSDNKVYKVRIADGVVSTFAGSGVKGDVDGAGSSAQFSWPAGVAVDANGNVYVADAGNNKIRKITSDGTVSTLAGSGVSGHDDGVGTAATFSSPGGMALAGNVLYVIDGSSIRCVSLDNGVVSTWAGSATEPSGSADGTRAEAKFSGPEGIAVDASGTVYVADTRNQAIRKIVPNGSDILVSTLAGSVPVCRDGEAPCGASSLAVAADGMIYAATGSQISAITPAGEVSRLAGSDVSGCMDGVGVDASFSRLADMAIGLDGFIYAADMFNSSIRKISPEGTVTTVDVFGRDSCYSPITALLGVPMGVAVGADGTIYVADSSDHTILKVINGAVEILAGSIGVTGNQDGMGAAASFSSPSDIVMGVDGNLYVADGLNARIRKVTPTGVVTTLAGSAPGYADGAGAAADFGFLQGIAVDAAGNLFVADTNNNLIRKVTPAGRVTTVAGTFGKMGTTLGKLPATLANPLDVAVDGAGRLLITSGNAIVVAEKPGGF